jgi:hypothetical protein
MANRNRNSSIWKDTFYRALPPLYKCLWDYINDDCDNAGVWVPDFKVASICIGRRVKPEVALASFKEKVIVLDNGNWLLPNFISERLCFTELKPTDRFQKSIIELLNKHKLFLNKGLTSPLQGAIRNTYTEAEVKAEAEEGVQGEFKGVEIGKKNGHSITIKAKYLNDKPIIIHDLKEYFTTTNQLEDIQRAGWIDFTGFMKANPAAMFEDSTHLYHAFKKHCHAKHPKSTTNSSAVIGLKTYAGKL